MNRDEKIARVEGLPPRWHCHQSIRMLAPSEPKGGLWVALTEQGASFALINWYSIRARATRAIVSRGDIIPALADRTAPAEIRARLANFPLERTNPFRLVVISPQSGTVDEWRWDLQNLQCQPCRWEAQQWISSGHDEPGAQTARSRTFAEARPTTRADLRSLHASHLPTRGPYSTCMHRADARTVSYTEIEFQPDGAQMRYIQGNPCEGAVQDFTPEKKEFSCC